MVLPTLVYSGLTKVNNEVTVFANLGNGMRTKQIGVGSTILDTSCVAGEECPLGSFLASVVSFPNKGAIGTIPANSPTGTAAEGELTPTVLGDSVDVLCLPSPADDFLICYDQGIQVAPGETYRAISRKFNPVDHIVRTRGEQTLTLSDLFVSSWDGLQRIRGRRVTIIVKIAPGGGGVYSEIQYYVNVTLNTPPMNSANDGNASIEIQASGPYSYFAVFSAPRP